MPDTRSRASPLPRKTRSDDLARARKDEETERTGDCHLGPSSPSSQPPSCRRRQVTAHRRCRGRSIHRVAHPNDSNSPPLRRAGRPSQKILPNLHPTGPPSAPPSVRRGRLHVGKSIVTPLFFFFFSFVFYCTVLSRRAAPPRPAPTASHAHPAPVPNLPLQSLASPTHMV